MSQPPTHRRVNDLMKVVGFDPSLSNWGIAVGTLDVQTKAVTITFLDVIKTAPTKEKSVRKNSTDLDRAELLVKGALGVLKGAQAVFVEVPVGSQTARAMTSYGVCVGILAAFRAAGKPFFIISPDEVKKVTGGKSTASKADMIKWAMDKHPEANWPMQSRLGVIKVVAGEAEHMADAVACIHAGVNSQQFKQLLALLNPTNN